MTIAELLTVTVGAVLVNNIVLSRILGICPFLGVSKKLKTAAGMGSAVTLVMTISSFVTALLFHLLLKNPISIGGSKNVDLSFAKTLVFIVVIASLVQIVEILMQKFSKNLYQALGIYLPLITTNCAVLGAAELNAASGRSVLLSTIYGCCSGLGFALSLLLFASIRERLELSRIPKIFQGASIALVTAGILAMAFMGFAGLVK